MGPTPQHTHTYRHSHSHTLATPFPHHPLPPLHPTHSAHSFKEGMIGLWPCSSGERTLHQACLSPTLCAADPASHKGDLKSLPPPPLPLARAPAVGQAKIRALGPLAERMDPGLPQAASPDLHRARGWPRTPPSLSLPSAASAAPPLPPFSPHQDGKTKNIPASSWP